MWTQCLAFLRWLGTSEEDREIKSAVRECMRFLCFAGIAAGSIWSGAESFDWGEARTTLLMTVSAFFGSKAIHG